jgi:hypothetical protein
LKDVAAHAGLSLGGARNRINRLLSSGVMTVGALKQRSDMSNDFLFGLGINTKGESEGVEELIKKLRSLPTVTYTEQWLHVRIAFESY